MLVYRLSAMLCLLLLSLPALAVHPPARVESFDNNWADPGFTVTYSAPDSLELVYSLPRVTLSPVTVEGEAFTAVAIPGAMLPTNPGEPNLPGSGRFVALPNGARAVLSLLDSRTRVFAGINVVPSAELPLEGEDQAPVPRKDKVIYATDAVWPAQPVRLAATRRLRGVDATVLGITPFAWNPVSRELTVYTDLRIRITFEGGDGTFGDPRLRSRYWDPILERQLLNFDRLSAVDSSSRDYSDRDGVEYIIITPDDGNFTAWGQAIAEFRMEQGISSRVYSVTEIGGNTVAAIEGFIDDAYANWSTAPVAFLILGDYVDPGQPGGVTSGIAPHPYGSCASDNVFADVDGDSLPDLVSARITARDDAELAIMINKFLDYELNPPTAANFYDEPLVACGFQTERWFQLCSEVVRGYWENVLGKNPGRQYKVYSGTPDPGDPWSTNTNTYMITDYFGESGLQYIPDTIPAGIDWNGGSAAGVSAAINSGCFILQHRDHGAENGWSEPSYTTSDLAALTNTMLPWVFSINCLTGKFNYSSEVFAERFHRMEGGALGITAATEVSYSFVNDTYIFGIYDSLWPDFDPGYPVAGRDTGSEEMRPAFSNVSGKYYLEASNWPYNPSDKEVTYNLFHSHSDAFVTLFSELPATMTVAHAPTMFSMTPTFTMTAPAGSVIALTRNGQILGVADGTGFPTMISIPLQLPGPPPVKLVVTKPNHYRYEAEIEVIPQDGPFVSYEIHALDDDNSGSSSGNGDGIATPGETIELDLGLKNWGVDSAYGVSATVSTASPHISFIDDTAVYGDFAPNESRTNLDGLVFQVLGSCPHNEEIQFTVSSTDGVEVWESYFSITVEAAQLALYGFVLSDSPEGNNDGDVDMGETAYVELTLENVGGVDTENVSATITTSDPAYVTVLDGTASFPDIPAGGTAASDLPHFRFSVDLSTPCGELLTFQLNIATDQGSASDTLAIQVGGTGLFFEDDMESGGGGWTHFADQGADDWAIQANSYAHSPTHDWFCSDVSSVKDDFLITPELVVTNLSEFSFWHRYNMETGYDGCVIEISIGGGAWEGLGPQITQGGYNDTISTCCSNPIGGQQAWSGDSGSAMTRVVVDLSPYSGTTAQLRFRLATDSSVSDDGWYVDDVAFTGAECQPWEGAADTISADLSCMPGSGTLPFNIVIMAQFDNLSGSNRRVAGRIDFTAASGTTVTGYRAGFTNMTPYGTFSTSWVQNIPAYGSLVGDNQFLLLAEDVTPAPYNQPPYPASGDTATDNATVTGLAP